MRIDTHVHCRDGFHAYKATIGEVMSLAKEHGIVAVCDMPNKAHSITSKRDVNYFLSLAGRQGFPDGYYLYVGLTTDTVQVKGAVKLAKEHPRVVGLKCATADFGPLTIERDVDQHRLYQTLAELGYEGILCVHSENRDMFRMEEWDPSRPWTWNDARPPEAEVDAVENQISLAKEYGFRGTLYIPHVTVPGSVDMINSARNSIRIVCGVTPHHLMMSTEEMMRINEQGGNSLWYKVNPPIRGSEDVGGLWKHLFAGRIDWIETDHAPHTEEENLQKYHSGHPSLNLYTRLLQKLRSSGVSEDEIDNLTYHNAKRVFTKILE